MVYRHVARNRAYCRAGFSFVSTLKAPERHRRIIEALTADRRVTVADLCDLLSVSSVTVRADLAHLERARALRRIRGGAVAAEASRFEQSLDLDAPLLAPEKRAIAALAAGLVRDGETVILGAGATTAAMAEALPTELADLAVATNGLNVAAALSAHPGVRVLVTGGTMRKRLNSLVSPFGTLLFEQINADVVFLGCAGVSAERGFTDSAWEEAEVKRAMIRAAGRVVFLADHSKLKRVAAARIAGIAEAHLLITDSRAPTDAVRDLRAAGLEVVVA
jgi:DeoR family transcriptional regulator of aga operon